MVTVRKITMISKSSLEAEVIITDGFNELICFSQPCNFSVNQKLIEPVYCYNNKNVVRSFSEEYDTEKLEEKFSYKLVGKLTDKKNYLVNIGDLALQLEVGSLPKDILENEYVSFYCQRIDIY